MHTLDNITKIKKLDQSNILDSIELLGEQLAQAFTEAKALKLPASYKKVAKIVINGMGGSGLGAHFIKALFFQKLKVSLDNIHSYNLPGVIDKNTLYIFSSYSGNTEEILYSLESAIKAKAKILCVTSGGKLGELVKKNKIPSYLFNPRYNPSGEPRLGLGYAVGGLMGVLKNLKLLSLLETEMQAALSTLIKGHQEFGVNIPYGENQAKQIAVKFTGRLPLIIAADFLAGNAHIFANQLNETGKNFAIYFLVPELNHHLMEGLANPKTNPKNLIFFFAESGLYYDRLQKRFEIMKDILRRHKIDYVSYNLQGKTELSAALELLLFGSYVSYYLARQNNLNPAAVPWVRYFKSQLAG